MDLYGTGKQFYRTILFYVPEFGSVPNVDFLRHKLLEISVQFYVHFAF